MDIMEFIAKYFFTKADEIMVQVQEYANKQGFLFYATNSFYYLFDKKIISAKSEEIKDILDNPHKHNIAFTDDYILDKNFKDCNKAEQLTKWIDIIYRQQR